jgi:hypothetical protein
MALTEETDPGSINTGPRPVRVVRLQSKDWAIALGALMTVVTAAGFILGLMYYSKTEGERLRADHDHHVAESVPKIQKNADELRITKDELTEALHRIELRQVELAPRHKRRSLPVVPPLDNGTQ